MKKIINYFGGEKKFYIILTVLILMWVGLIGFYYLKADEITKNPCQICAKRMDSTVTCIVQGGGMIRKGIYYPNFSIKTTLEGGDNPSTLLP